LQRAPGPPEIPIAGEYRGLDGMRTFFDRSAAAIAYESAPTIHEIHASGNLVVITGHDRLRAIPTGKSFATSWMHIYEFEKERIARFDNWGNLAVIREAFQPG
jgi:ketosteroid isomerase-like protein